MREGFETTERQQEGEDEKAELKHSPARDGILFFLFLGGELSFGCEEW